MSLVRSALSFLAAGALFAWTTAAPAAEAVTPLKNAHAHNDYEHPHPLFDALDHGFCSVEADIYLVDGKLLVAHDRKDLDSRRTLQVLYLDPLRARAERNHGVIYTNATGFTLMIDVKSEAEPTWRALALVLADYREMLTEFSARQTRTRAVTVVISGNRAPQLLAQEPSRLASIDGRLADLEGKSGADLVPWISDDWNAHFRWRGQGPMTSEEAERLKAIVRRAHEQGRRVRFWGAPDTALVWSAFLDGGVDLISTDDLGGFARFMRARR